MREDIAVLFLMGPGLSGQAGMLVDCLTEAWRDLPPVYAGLRTGAPPAGERTIFYQEPDWVPSLKECLIELRRRQPAARYVLLLIDDHCPLAPCDARKLDQVVRIAIEREWAHVAFVTYRWPWDVPRHRWLENGRIMGWEKVDVSSEGGHRFARMPERFFRYNQVQPALWDLDYLLWICESAVEKGLSDPWAFEEMLLDGQRTHWISDYAWPSVHHGFQAQGRVQAEAIHRIRAYGPALRRLKGYLASRYIKESGHPYFLAVWWGRMLRWKRHFRFLRHVISPTSQKGG